MSLQGEIHISGLFTREKTIKKREQRDRDRRGTQINVTMGNVLFPKLRDELLCLIIYACHILL